MIEAWKDHLYGQTERQIALGSGRQDSQTITETKTACILLVQRKGTLGMTCPVITVTTSLVLKVKQHYLSLISLMAFDSDFKIRFFFTLS